MKRFTGIKKLGIMGIAAITAMVFILLISGCVTTTGSDRSAAASVTMVQVENDIRLLLLELSSTNSSLASLINPLQDDLPSAYSEFSEGSDSLKETSEQFITRSTKMGVEGRKYFEEWRIQGDTYDNPQIQALSEQRRTELSAVYAEIGAASVGIHAELTDYVLKVQEVETYFSTDLTAMGVATISPFANRTILDGSRLSMKLRDLLSAVSNVRAELSPGETAVAE